MLDGTVKPHVAPEFTIYFGANEFTVYIYVTKNVTTIKWFVNWCAFNATPWPSLSFLNDRFHAAAAEVAEGPVASTAVQS